MKRKATARQKKNRPNNVVTEDAEAVTAQISVPHENGHAWLVLCAAFANIFIADGVVFTFGSILLDISKDLMIAESLAALLNSTCVAMYFLASPMASAIINRYGFRTCIMSGSIISSFSFAVAYFFSSYGFLIIFYGVFAGFGCSLINMSSVLIVGFYFERLRSVAMCLASSGSSVGVMVLYPVNTYMVNLVGWRTTILFHCGLLGMVFFFGMAYRPLLCLNVTPTESSPPEAELLPDKFSGDSIQVTKLSSQTPSTIIPMKNDRVLKTPSVAKYPTVADAINSNMSVAVQPGTSAGTSKLTLKPMMFKNTSNVRYPTAAEAISSNMSVAVQQGTSSRTSRLTLRPTAPTTGLSQRQLKQIQSIISKTSQNEKVPNIELRIDDEGATTSREGKGCCACCGRFCHWESHTADSRPMYRDDAFYEGSIKELDAYRKSVMDTKEEDRTGLEYRMAVSRTVAITDLNERRSIFSTAIRRVLATMMDPTLLKRYSFLLIALSGFVTYLGYLVPYVYLEDRNIKAGLDPKDCTFLVSAIGFSNAIGRIVAGCIASKVEPLKVFACLYTLAGLSTVCSTLSYNLYFQYFYSCTYGFCLGSSSLRSVILVSLYGLDKLTNATGMLLIFLGLGNLASTPLASVLKNLFGYQFAFVVAGVFVSISGIILFPIKSLALRNK